MIDTFIGKTLAEKYRIDSVMRETELGKVYHATHLLMEKPVAVKILSPALAVDAGKDDNGGFHLGLAAALGAVF